MTVTWSKSLNAFCKISLIDAKDNLVTVISTHVLEEPKFCRAFALISFFAVQNKNHLRFLFYLVMSITSCTISSLKVGVDELPEVKPNKVGSLSLILLYSNRQK